LDLEPLFDATSLLLAAAALFSLGATGWGLGGGGGGGRLTPNKGVVAMPAPAGPRTYPAGGPRRFGASRLRVAVAAAEASASLSLLFVDELDTSLSLFVALSSDFTSIVSSVPSPPASFDSNLL
jgi:hypothetical protein